MGVNYSLIRKNKGNIDMELLLELKKIKLRDIQVKIIY
jgi:hypothetical protein